MINQVRLITEGSVQQCGTLELSRLPPANQDREIQVKWHFLDTFWSTIHCNKRPIRYNILIDLIIKVRMKFGDTEIKATALDLATGQVQQITNPSFHCFYLQIQCSLLIFLTVLSYESQTKRFSSRFFFPFSRRCTLLWTSSQTPIQSTAPSSELIWVPRS